MTKSKEQQLKAIGLLEKQLKVYAVYDNQMRELKELLLFKDLGQAEAMLKEMASSVNSPYYQNSKSYDVYILGFIDYETMDFVSQRSYFGSLNSFVDGDRVKFQRVIQTLNFLPTGYFKMPKEMQDEIKDDIDNAVKEYVENYIDFDKIKVQKEEETVNVKE